MPKYPHVFLVVLTLTLPVVAGGGCADGDEAIGTQFAALTDESHSACMDRCEQADWPEDRCDRACSEQRQDPCYEDCHASGKSGEECRAECADAGDENGLSAEEMAAYEACQTECLASGKDAVECREECSP